MSNYVNFPDGINQAVITEIGPNLAQEISTSNSNFQQYVKGSKSEFAAFEPVTINNICRLL